MAEKNIWSDANAVTEEAAKSGKPLEVACAQALLASGWKARLGSYFFDGALGVEDKIRELDILAEKDAHLPILHGVTLSLRALVSCRGFRPEHCPLAFSVSEDCVPGFEPRLIAAGRVSGSIPELEKSCAEKLLRATNLAAARPLVAFSVLTNPNQKKSDSDVFSAIDSATKAAFHWRGQAPAHHAESGYITVNLPICVFDREFWDVCIDGGKSAKAELRGRGYQTCSYPQASLVPRVTQVEATVLISTKEDFPQLVKDLNNFLQRLCNYIDHEARNPN